MRLRWASVVIGTDVGASCNVAARNDADVLYCDAWSRSTAQYWDTEKCHRIQTTCISTRPSDVCEFRVVSTSQQEGVPATAAGAGICPAVHKASALPKFSAYARRLDLARGLISRHGELVLILGQAKALCCLLVSVACWSVQVYGCLGTHESRLRMTAETSTLYIRRRILADLASGSCLIAEAFLLLSVHRWPIHRHPLVRRQKLTS